MKNACLTKNKQHKHFLSTAKQSHRGLMMLCFDRLSHWDDYTFHTIVEFNVFIFQLSFFCCFFTIPGSICGIMILLTPTNLKENSGRKKRITAQSLNLMDERIVDLSELQWSFKEKCFFFPKWCEMYFAFHTLLRFCKTNNDSVTCFMFHFTIQRFG